MAYRNLTFRSLAVDTRIETYLGEDHIVVPCIALVGDEVVYGMNADGPEFIPAEELEFSTLGWSGRPVLYDHPSNSTMTANEPATLQAMSFGQIFYPRFEDGKLKVEAWCNRRRALEIGQEDLITSIENGEVIELSVGAIISLDKTPGIAPNGKKYTAKWFAIQSDHLAVGLSGSQGACNIEMGCGMNRVLKGSTVDNDTDTRTMRANRGVDIMHVPETRTTAAVTNGNRKPRQSSEGISFESIRNWLNTALSKLEPGANWLYVEDIYETSVVYSVHFDNSPSRLYERSYTIAGEVVTVSSERIEVRRKAVEYEPVTVVQVEKEAKPPCGCQSVSADQSVAANEIDKPKEDSTMPEDKDKKNADATPPATPATGTPAAPAVPTPEKGSSEAATPSQSGSTDKTIPNYPAGEPNPSGDLPGTGTSTAVTSEQLKALLEEHPVVKHYRAQEAKERTGLVAALVKAQKVLTQAQLEAKPIEDLRQIAELVGVGMQQPQPTPCDFSGRMMVARESELPPPPDPHGVAKYLKGRDTAN